MSRGRQKRVRGDAVWQATRYDGHYPISVLKEPCWSAALSKWALERNRTQYHNDARKAPQR